MRCIRRRPRNIERRALSERTPSRRGQGSATGNSNRSLLRSAKALALHRARRANAYTVAGFPLINTSLACADHHAVPGFLFAAKINHCVRDRWVALDRIGAGPEKQIARL